MTTPSTGFCILSPHTHLCILHYSLLFVGHASCARRTHHIQWGLVFRHPATPGRRPFHCLVHFDSRHYPPTSHRPQVTGSVGAPGVMSHVVMSHRTTVFLTPTHRHQRFSVLRSLECLVGAVPKPRARAALWVCSPAGRRALGARAAWTAPHRQGKGKANSHYRAHD